MRRLGGRPVPYDGRSLLTVAAMLAAVLLPPLVVYEPIWELAAALGYGACAAAVAARLASTFSSA